MIDVLVETGLDGIVATNTTTRRDGLETDPATVAAIGNGGLSGGPLTRRSLEVVRYIHKKTEGRFPIIGVGGIMTEDDAVAMLNRRRQRSRYIPALSTTWTAIRQTYRKRLKQEAESKTKTETRSESGQR